MKRAHEAPVFKVKLETMIQKLFRAAGLDSGGIE